MTLKIACRAGDNDKHEWDISYLLFHKNKLYSAADDGKIKIWSQDLVKLAETNAHPCSVFGLAANEDTLFSCSSDGTIKLWGLDTLKEKGTLVTRTEVEFWRVACSAGCLFSGDDQGNINVYKNGKFYGQINVAEPSKDMTIDGTILFSARDLYLVITEIKLEGKEIQYDIIMSFMGRAPITLIGDSLFAFGTREGTGIQLHENNKQTGFKEVAKIAKCSDMIINALAGVKWDDTEQLFSGGWDKLLKQWTIKNNCPNNESNLDVELVITAIVCGQKNQVYVGGADGHILRIDVI